MPCNVCRPVGRAPTIPCRSFRVSKKKRLSREPPIPSSVHRAWHCNSPAKSYLKVSSKLVVAFHVSSVVERRLISGTKVGRYPIECQFASHVMEVAEAPEVMLLRNNHDILQQKRSPGLRINDLPSFFQNRRQARYRKRV